MIMDDLSISWIIMINPGMSRCQVPARLMKARKVWHLLEVVVWHLAAKKKEEAMGTQVYRKEVSPILGL